MYNGIGLQTPRGSGTNGYIQSNKFFVKGRSSATTPATANAAASSEVKKANKEILEHDRKRQIEVKLLVLQEALTDQGYTDSEISQKLDQARKDLEAQQQPAASASSSRPPVPRFSDTQTHQVAARKEKQMETLRAAFGIKHPEEPSAPEIDEQKQENEAYSDNEERETANDPHQKRESRNHDTPPVEEMKNSRKENKTVDDSKTVKNLKTDMKEPDRKKGDNRRFGEGRHSSGSDSDDGERHKEGGKSHKKVTTGHDSKYGRGRRTMNSDSDSSSGEEIRRKRAQTYIEKRKRHGADSDSDPDLSRKRSARESDSDDSESDGDYQKKGKKVVAIEPKQKHATRNKIHDKYSRRHDSDSDSGSDSDDSESEGHHKTNRERKHDRRHGPNDSDDDSKTHKYAIKSKKHDKYSGRRDSEDDQSEDFRKLGSGRHGTEESGKRSEKHEENNRKMDVADVRARRDDMKRKRSDHDTDDEADSGEGGRERKPQLPDRSDSDDDLHRSRARHANKITRTGLDDDRMSDKFAKKHDGRYDGKDRNSTDDGSRSKTHYESRRNDYDVDGSRKQGVAAGTVDSKSKSSRSRKEGESRGHSHRGGGSEYPEKPATEGRRHGSSRNRGEDEESHDNTKRGYDNKRQHAGRDNFEHRYGEDSGRRRRQ